MHDMNVTHTIVTKTVAIIAGAVCGAFVGFVLGVLAAIAFTLSYQWIHDNDPGSAMAFVVVILTAPGGAALGAAVGGLMAALRPRLFLFTLLPLSVVLIAGLAVHATLRQMDRPRDFALALCGTPDAQFIGVVSVDGKKQRHEGALPETICGKGLEVDYAFALVNPSCRDRIAVDIYVNEKRLQFGIESDKGVSGKLKSFGCSEFFGGTSRTWSRTSKQEVDRLIKDWKKPESTLESYQ